MIVVLLLAAAAAALPPGAAAAPPTIDAARPLPAAAAPPPAPPASSGEAHVGTRPPAAAVPADGAAPSVSAPASPDSAVETSRGPIDYLWVLRGSLVDRPAIDSLVARSARMGVRGLLVQVVGRGDAFYHSELLPRAEAIAHRPASFDPLAEVLARARPAGLEVHAWMNCMLVWSAPSWPRDPRHVLNQHPEWVAALADGRRMTLLAESERRRLAVEGVFLSPAHPRVREWLARVAAEIARRYEVDGIHLDYIRQPGAAVGFDPTTRARFAMESGIDPERFDAVEPGRRAAVAAAWAAFQREQVTACVRQVRDSLRAARPAASLSAAVIADTLTAERRNAQAWREWVRTGVLDRVFLMSYAPSTQTVMDQLLALTRDLGASDRVVPGIAVFNTSTGTAALKIKGARALGFPRVALYSYDSLHERAAGWASLRRRLDPAGDGAGRTP